MITNDGFPECIILYNALCTICTMHAGETMHCKPCSVAVNYQYRRYKSIWKFRSIIDMDFSISIYRISDSLPLWPHGLRGTLNPCENKGTLAGTRQLKRISEQRDTVSCHLSHLLCLFKGFNRHERPMLSQSELLRLEICVDNRQLGYHYGTSHQKKRFCYDGKFLRKGKWHHES